MAFRGKLAGSGCALYDRFLLRRRGIANRLAKGVDLVTQVLARDLIELPVADATEARRVTDCGCRARGCLENFFAEANP